MRLDNEALRRPVVAWTRQCFFQPGVAPFLGSDQSPKEGPGDRSKTGRAGTVRPTCFRRTEGTRRPLLPYSSSVAVFVKKIRNLETIPLW